MVQTAFVLRLRVMTLRRMVLRRALTVVVGVTHVLTVMGVMKAVIVPAVSVVPTMSVLPLDVMMLCRMAMRRAWIVVVSATCSDVDGVADAEEATPVRGLQRYDRLTTLTATKD